MRGGGGGYGGGGYGGGGYGVADVMCAHCGMGFSAAQMKAFQQHVAQCAGYGGYGGMGGGGAAGRRRKASRQEIPADIPKVLSLSRLLFVLLWQIACKYAAM